MPDQTVAEEPPLLAALSPLEAADRAFLDPYIKAMPVRIADYSFASLFMWRRSNRLRWGIVEGSLCIFANGTGWSLLLPPLGGNHRQASLRSALAICDEMNGRPGSGYVEYVTDADLDLLGQDMLIDTMSGDYIYPTARMIDLAGGDLASKRQGRNRFARQYQARTEPYDPARHAADCRTLLAEWGTQAAADPAIIGKRSNELDGAADLLADPASLGLTGMVLYAGDALAGFTFGELLAADTCGILVEKTLRSFVGSAQYIFSEFCRQHWAATAWCNVGDDWDVPSLAWTKQSYRPAHRIPKFRLRPEPRK